MTIKILNKIRSIILLCFLLPFAANAQEDASIFQWQTNEVHYQYGGNFKTAYSGNNNTQNAHIFTLQHADGWKYGDNFFFVDLTESQFADFDVYGEFYSNFSLGKITGNDFSAGAISDVGVIAGFNYAKNAKVRKFLPGVRLAWNIPNFAFLNTDVTAYIDDSRGVAKGGAPKETTSFMVDVNWALPFSIGNHDFSIEGHIEYIDGRSNEFGGDVSYHILGQPQFRYDLGKTLFDAAGHLFVGLEYQFWINKLGDPTINEHVAQALVVGRF